MITSFHCAWMIIWYITIPLFLGALLWRFFWYKPVRYHYALAEHLSKMAATTSFLQKYGLTFLRAISLFLLMILAAQPQLVDERSQVQVEGIDIVMVLDMSGSMQLRDFTDDDRSRVQVAKDEAIRFVQKRYDDAIGLVVFAREAVTRCPLTLDHTLVKSVLYDLQIGIVDPEKTMIATGIATAVNRLRSSTAKSKIMILLTDGEPHEDDIDMDFAINAAKSFGIKIYTVGIGSEEERLFMHPFYGPVKSPKVNKDLLTHIALQTGGQYFHVQSASDMRLMYDMIDTLERSSKEHARFKSYKELLIPFGMAAFMCMALEVICSTYIWFAL